MYEPVACRNIGPRQRRLRLFSGIGLFGLTGALASMLLAQRVGRGWRVLVAVPCMVGASSFFEATDHTCVALARRGFQNLDTHLNPLEGTQIVGNQVLRDRLLRQATGVQRKAWATTVVVTAAVLALPEQVLPPVSRLS